MLMLDNNIMAHSQWVYVLTTTAGRSRQEQGHTSGYYEVAIAVVGSTDQFKWRKVVAGVAGPFSPATFIQVNTAQLLAEGVFITFATNTGHTVAGAPSEVWKVDVHAVNPLAIFNANGTRTFMVGQDGSVHSDGDMQIAGGLTLLDSGLVVEDTLRVNRGGITIDEGGLDLTTKAGLGQGAVSLGP
jgi:hypothetical protein